MRFGLRVTYLSLLLVAIYYPTVIGDDSIEDGVRKLEYMDPPIKLNSMCPIDFGGMGPCISAIVYNSKKKEPYYVVHSLRSDSPSDLRKMLDSYETEFGDFKDVKIVIAGGGQEVGMVDLNEVGDVPGPILDELGIDWDNPGNDYGDPNSGSYGGGEDYSSYDPGPANFSEGMERDNAAVKRVREDVMQEIRNRGIPESRVTVRWSPTSVNAELHFDPKTRRTELSFYNGEGQKVRRPIKKWPVSSTCVNEVLRSAITEAR